MKINTDILLAKLTKIFDFIRKYAVFASVILVLILYGFIVLQIRHYADIKPTDSEVAKKLEDLQTPKIDEDAVNKIKKLEAENIEVKALFDQARDNPFQE